jgi:hypothetical protein
MSQTLTLVAPIDPFDVFTSWLRGIPIFSQASTNASVSGFVHFEFPAFLSSAPCFLT